MEGADIVIGWVKDRQTYLKASNLADFRTIAPCKAIHHGLGFWIPPCGFRIPSTGFRIPKRAGFQIFFFFKCFSSHFVFVFESCYIESRCLECITSLFSFSNYKLREEMFYCSVRVWGIIKRGSLGDCPHRNTAEKKITNIASPPKNVAKHRHRNFKFCPSINLSRSWFGDQ